MPESTAFDSDSLLAFSPNPYLVIAGDDTIVWANRAYYAITGQPEDEVLGRKWHDAFQQDRGSGPFREIAESIDRVRAGSARDEVALIRCRSFAPDGSENSRFWNMVHTPVTDRGGQVVQILCSLAEVTELQELRTAHNASAETFRARRNEQRYAEAAAQIERSRAIVEQAPGIVCVLIGPQHRFELANAACREFWGRRELVGHTVAEILPEAVEQEFIAMLDEVFTTGQPFVGEKVPVRRITAGASGDEERYVDCIFQPIFDEDGTVLGIYAQGYDATAQVRADEQQALLVNELNHRVKNTLSIIQGLAYQSFGKPGGENSAYEGFRRRLDALAAAHGLLTEAKWEAAELQSVISTALQAATGADAVRCSICGERAELSPQVAVRLSMIVHELATNAIKYGALSDPKGKVEISLCVEPDWTSSIVTMTWRESGGPPVTPPARQGFGTRLVSLGLANHPRAGVTLDFAPQGLTCTIVAAVR